uniref:Uncharacterized protein n=1 Tax=Callorhinchus milii TaxID=7868 RepID=A0A4W3GKM1_CALMI
MESGGEGAAGGVVLHIVVVGFHHKKGCQVRGGGAEGSPVSPMSIECFSLRRYLCFGQLSGGPVYNLSQHIWQIIEIPENGLEAASGLAL